MNTKHTPGPWEIIQLGKESIVSNEHFSRIAVVTTTHKPPEEIEANKRLLAAAPDLLAAAVDTLRWLKENHRADEPEFFGNLKQAIAKATGDQ